MLVDTGAHRTFVLLRSTEVLGIPARALPSSRSFVGLGGLTQQGYSAYFSEFSIGSSRSVSAWFPVMPGLASSGFGAILGVDYLLQADLEIDLGARRMQFNRLGKCSKTAHLVAGASVLDMETDPYIDTPLFYVKVNGIPTRAIIDTGAPSTAIRAGAARRAGIAPAMPGAEKLTAITGIGEGSLSAWGVTVAEMQIGDDTFKDLKITLFDSKEDDHEGSELILGVDFLRSYRVLFSSSQRRIYLTRTAPLKFMVSRADWVEWLESEAANGSHGAMAYLAKKLEDGVDVPKDPVRAAKLAEEAAARGDYMSMYKRASDLFLAGEYAEAAPALRQLAQSYSSDREAELRAYLATAHNGDPESARKELKAARKRANEEVWPMPIVDYIINDGKPEKLLLTAGKEEQHATARQCLAHYYIGETARLKGDNDAARKSFESALAICPASAFEHKASTLAIKQTGI